MRAGFPNIWVIIGVIIIVVGGNLLITVGWGYKHYTWGLPLTLAVLLLVAIEGSSQIEVTNKAELATEREAYRITAAELEAARETPVSPGHRDELKSLVRKVTEQVNGSWPCRYFDCSHPNAMDLSVISVRHSFPGGA